MASPRSSKASMIADGSGCAVRARPGLPGGDLTRDLVRGRPQPGAAALSAPGPTGADVDAANLPVRQQCFLVLWRPGTGSRVSRMGSPPRFALAENPHGHPPPSAPLGAP